MPIHCRMMQFSAYRSVSGKTVVKDYYLELCFKLWRLLIWMIPFGTVIYTSLSCETSAKMLNQHASELFGATPPKSMVLYSPPREVITSCYLMRCLFLMLSLFPMQKAFKKKKIFFFSHGDNEKLHIYMSIWFVSDREKNLSPNLAQCKHEWILVLSVREKVGIKLVSHQWLFFLYRNEGIINCNNKLQGLW